MSFRCNHPAQAQARSLQAFRGGADDKDVGLVDVGDILEGTLGVLNNK